MRLSLILLGLSILLKFTAWRYPAFRKRLKEKNFTAQIKTWDNGVGRSYTFRDGKTTSRSGVDPNADICMSFKTEALGTQLLMPPINWLDQINALKDFKLKMEGDDGLANWFAQTTMMTQSIGWQWGSLLADGTRRTCNMTNGGPVFVDVKDDKIIRMTPIEFGDDDTGPWTIKARGMEFTPPRKTTLAPHGQNAKSIVYSPDRLLYPMKRVDFDPDRERNPQNRGISGYERISW